MPKEYVGHLSRHDPLYNYLRHDILPQMGAVRQPVDFRVFRLQDSRVYLYEGKDSPISLVGKFFAGKGGQSKSNQRMQHEFDNLHRLRGYGLAGYPHQVVRPLGANSDINSVLIMEYCHGISLSTVINDAIYLKRDQELFSRLTALAYFLATLHNRTANGWGVDFAEDCSYLERLIEDLQHRNFIRDRDQDELYWLRDRWREQPRMWEDQQVLVHGDATPSNFLFGDDLSVIAIDLERMKRADRVFDVGRIAGELQHFYLMATGNKYAAEPFIGHFLWEYACHFPDRERAFRSITGRVPFQMGLTLLRIARNFWISEAYRQLLLEEAKNILRRF